MNLYDVLLAKKLNGEGGGEAVLIDKSINANGTYNASSDNADGYKKVVVNVPTGITPTGTLSISSNGTYDVSSYASADVNVPTNEWIKKDGKTHLHINIFNDMFLTVHMMFGQTVASGNTIYWGDGTSTTPTNTSSALQSHTYSQKGEYDITVENTNGYFFLGQDSTTRGYIFQDGIANAYQAKYEHYCTILKKVELGKGWKCDYGRQFANCRNLTDVYINTKPTQTNFSGNMFINCSTLTDFDGVTGYLDGITTIGGSVFSNTGLQEMPVFPSATIIPNSFLSTISGMSSLTEVDIWEGITQINNTAFRYQAQICEITIPSTVTSIQSQAFDGAVGVHAIHLKPSTPPTLANTNALPSASNAYDLKIYVPSASLSAYQGASNWSSFASYMIGE